jgi:uncharacterized protein (TIGR04255 family)
LVQTEKFSKNKIKEASIILHFDPSTNDWASTLFGNFYDLIKPLGFTKRKDLQPVTVQFQYDGGSDTGSVQRKLDTPKMLFQRDVNDFAVVQSAYYLSVHKTDFYTGFEEFYNFVKQVFAEYMKLKVAHSDRVRSIQINYINTFNFSSPERSIGDLLRYFPKPERYNAKKELQHSFESIWETGNETSIKIHGYYRLQENLKLEIAGKRDLTNTPLLSETFEDSVEQVHRETSFAFRQTISDNLYQLLK